MALVSLVLLRLHTDVDISLGKLVFFPLRSLFLVHDGGS